MIWSQFMKVDMRMMKNQWRSLAFFLLLDALIGVVVGNAVFVCSYVCFGALIFSVTPFLVESKSFSSFIRLLPGSETDRVAGRFAGFFVFLLGMAAYGIGVSAVLNQLEYLEIDNTDYYFVIAAVAICLIIGCAQMAGFYLLGRRKSEQWLNMLRLIPSLAFFLGMNYFRDFTAENPEQLLSLTRFVGQNKGTLLVTGVLVSLVVFAACICISASVVKRRDIE